MCVEELGLGLATVGALAVPPACTSSVKEGATGARYGDALPGD